MNMNRQVAMNIYKAQVSSDNAKGIKEIDYKGKIKKTYDGKDEYIIRAINLIIHSKCTRGHLLSEDKCYSER